MILGHVEVFDFEPGLVTMVGVGDLYVVSRSANMLRSFDDRWLRQQHQRSFDGQGKG